MYDKKYTSLIVFVKTFSPSSVDSDGIWWQFAYYLCYINSTLNPLCYALCNVNFRNTYTKILTCSINTQHHQRNRPQINRFSNK
jgi:muscarinic acetylcholine receptor M3